MDKLETLYNNLVEDGIINSEQVSLDAFRDGFVSKEGYRKAIHTRLTHDGFYKDTFESFDQKYTQKKNTDPNAQESFTGSKPKLSDTKLSSALFEEDKKDQFRTYFDITGKPKLEYDPDGRYLKGAIGDIINALPMGDFIDDQARAWGAGKEDVDVQELAGEFMNQWGKKEYSIDTAQKMLDELYESRNLPSSDESKKFQEVYNSNGADGFAAVKAVFASPSGAYEFYTRSLSSMVNWDNLAVGATAAAATVGAGAATGVGLVPSVFLALPAAMAAAGSNTDMLLSYANFFAEELGEDYTREDLKSLLEDQDRMQKIENMALARGVSIAAVSGLTAGISTSVAANVFRHGRKGLRPKVEAFGKVTPIQMAGGSASEGLAQVASGEQIKTGDIVLEGIIDPAGSLTSTIGGLGVSYAQQPGYKINGGLTTKADFLRRVNGMSDEQLKSAKFEVLNDEDTFKVLDDRMSSIKINDEVKELYGTGLDQEQTRRITELELEKKNIKKKDSDLGKKRVAEINQEIDEVLSIYKKRQEAIGVLSAPYYSRNITSVEDAVNKRKTREYKQYKRKAQKLAETMNLSVTAMNDAIGGYFLDDGTYLQELSTETYLENATYEEAIEFASVLGAITPETQESTIAGMIVGEGEGDATKFNFAIQNVNELEGARSALDELGIEYSMNTDTGEIGIIDFADGNDVELNEKIGTFVQVLNENNINHEQKLERIRSKYIGAEDRAENLRAIKENSDKYGENGESIRYIAEQAEKRNQDYLSKKKPNPEVEVEKAGQETESTNVVVASTKKMFDGITNTKQYKFLRRQFLNTFTSGSGLDTTTEELIRELRREGTAIQTELGYETALFSNQYKTETKKMTQEQADQFQLDVNDYLAGRRDVALSNEMKTIVDRMRSHIDNISDRLVQKLQDKYGDSEVVTDLIETIQGNKGVYLHRAYAAFKDTSYMQELLGSPENARSSINENYDLLVYENSIDKGISIQESQKQIDQLIDEMFTVPDRATFIASLSDGKISSPFLKKKNKNLTTTFRKFLGEINDPLYNYVNTVEKVSSYLSAVEYQSRLSDWLISSGIGKPEFQRGYKRLELGSQSFKELSKVYVPEDFYQSYLDMQRLSPIQNFGMKTIVGIQSIVKVGKTIVSPTTTARNYTSGALMAMMSNANLLNPFNWSTAIKSAGLAWDSRKSTKELRAEQQRLIKLGIVQDGGQSAEVLRIINDIYSTEGARRKGSLSDTSQAWKSILPKLAKLYTFGDDFFKTFAYYVNTDKLVKAGMSLEEAQIEAAARIRKNQPTYSELPRNIRGLRRNPLVGSFVSFPYLIAKAQAENLKTIQKDLKEGRTKMALEHGANIAMAYALTYGIAEASKAFFDIDDEEDKALKDMAPAYYRDANFIYLGKDKETNKLKYFDANSFAPQAQIMKPLGILLSERQGREAISDRALLATYSFVEPFVSPDITTQALANHVFGQELDIRTGTSGRKLPGDNMLDPERFAYTAEKLFAGAGRNALDFARAAGVPGTNKVNPVTGREYNYFDAFSALFGFRVQTTDWDTQLTNYARYQNRLKSGIKSSIVSEVKEQQALSFEDVQSTVADYVEQNEEYSSNLRHQIEAARKQGLTDTEIVEAFDSANLGSTNINALLKGESLQLSGIDKKEYDRQSQIHKDNPEVFSNIKRNMDMFNYIISQRTLDGETRNVLYQMMSDGVDTQEVDKYVQDRVKNIYKRNVQGLGNMGLKYNPQEVVEEEIKERNRYVQIYKAYRRVEKDPTLSNLPLDKKSIVDMAFEKDIELQSYLMFKYLDGDYSSKSLTSLNSLLLKLTDGKKMLKKGSSLFEMLQYRVKEEMAKKSK